ncbi:uncharacterized protein LOC126906786 [Daktulosphaira vitifoliae]|uniref:uncharacterized protein LOC126906786 n=1 Tax=Daktulosphaira vitifoliae TaxID=58002 RepID=UPI0021AA5945|nr:uncharacterized protein LOC126906786 [Daktulosphaira vitifoliae]
MIFKYIIILTQLNYTLGICFYDLQCNFTKYMLNYFNHNHRYLTEININKKKYNEIDLKMYGVSIQSHGEIVLIMLDALRKINDYNTRKYSKELMAINLYFNNVSGYLDMLATNKENEIDVSDLKPNVLQGYMIIHKLITSQLEKTLENICKTYSYDKEFVKCPNYNTSGVYNIENLRYTTDKLKNRLLKNNKEQNITDVHFENLNKSIIFIFFRLSYFKHDYWDFLPKNILLYDLMTNRQQMSERNLLLGSQARQHGIVENERPKNVLDILRFTPLTLNCIDGSQVTLYDIFKYVKYLFYRIDIQFFHTLVLTATFRPISLLIQYYMKILGCSTFIYNLDKPNATESKFVNNMNIIGSKILYYFQYYINLEIFGSLPSEFFKCFLIKTKECIDNFNVNNKNVFINLVSELIESLESFMLGNKIDYKISPDVITTENIDFFYKELEINMNQVQDYITELENNLESFFFIRKTFNVEYLFKLSPTHVLRPFIINQMCQSDVYSFLTNIFKGEKNVHMTIDQNNQREFYSVKKYTPFTESVCYLDDYVLYFEIK